MKYTGEFTKEISFPLGGIGTGSIGLGGDGRLIDWEIFNRPSKGSINGYTNFVIRAIRGDEITGAVLNGDFLKEYAGQYKRSKGHTGFGFGQNEMKLCGFPHFENVEFNGEFPFANIKFNSERFPANITMNAFNPFIPNDEDNSSIPAAFFEFEVENITDEDVIYEIAFSLTNPFKNSKNETTRHDSFTVVTLTNGAVSPEHIEYGDLSIATDCDKAFSQSYWYRGVWKDSIVTFWNEFSSKKILNDRVYDKEGTHDTCSLISQINVSPRNKKKVRFVLSWNIPNNYNYWAEDTPEIRKPWKNYYAVIFKDSVHSALYSLKNWSDLYSRTMKFKDALHKTSLPEEIIDAVSSNLSVLKSPTVLRLENGEFYGWEGVGELEGSCEGTCQHVWNYAYALCFLFPRLERSIRDLEFRYNTDENGKMGFRLLLPLGREMSDFRACLDGQMGAVIKCYREWKISGDNKWLSDNWDNIKKVLEYAWSDANEDGWDSNKDGVLEGRQHHTLDMELFGPSSWLEGMYLAALKAASEMGEFLGDTLKAQEYRDLFEKGYKWTKENLFNNKYFIQKVELTDKSITDKFNASDGYWNDETNEIKYQIGEGSSIDQVLAQWHADIIGLGEIFDREQLLVALSEMFKNNFKPNMREFVNPWRIFSVNDEAGSVICDYPKGAYKPKIPVPYCEETMTGFEYSFAGILCSNNMIDEAFKVVKAIRDRFDGNKRNPWNEFECGSNYARSMASYALLPILSGFEFDIPHHYIGFNPYNTNDFMCFWSIDGAWGTFEIHKNIGRITLYEGNLNLEAIGVKFCEKVSSVKIDDIPAQFQFENGIIKFDKRNIKQFVEFTR